MDVCRTCMNARGNELVGSEFRSIFSIIEVEEATVYIADCLTQWVGRKVKPNDGMPSEICQPCLEAIKSITLFIHNAKDCDDNLRHMLVDHSEESESPNDDAVLEVKVEIADDSDTSSENKPTADSNKDQHSDHRNISVTDVGLVRRKKNSIKEEADMVEIIDEDQLTDQEHNDSNQDDSDSNDEDQHTDRSFSYVDVSTVDRKPCRIRIPRQRKMKNDDSNRAVFDLFNAIDVKKQNLCCGCFQVFDSKKELELHGPAIHEETKKRNNRTNYEKKFFCKFCFRRFDNDPKLQAHYEQYRLIDTVFECKKCNKRFMNYDTCIKHALTHPSVNVDPPKLFPVPMVRLEKNGYLCCMKKCEVSHTSEDALLEHMKQDHDLKRNEHAQIKCGEFVCPFCCRSYDSLRKFQYHYLTKYTSLTMVGRHQCDQCGKTYKSAASLTNHVNQHAQIKPFECDVCSKRFYSDVMLKQHKLIHTQEKKHICSICGTTFRTKMFLENHYRVHSDDKPFVCDICHKAFRHTSSLFIHKRTHEVDKRFKCTECGKGFIDAANLNRHMVSHTGIKPYQCNHCEKRFMRLLERSEHESIVHMGIMPYCCEVCGKDFASKRPYMKHESSCTGERLP